MTSPVFVSVANLSKRFGAQWALARASFEVRKGKLALLTGPNGSGKTTLLRCLQTALVPDYGSASVGGMDLVSERDQVRQVVGSLSQPPGFYGGLSARENLALAQDVLALGESGAIDSVLDRVGLLGSADVPLDAYSAGMRQRFALARLDLLRRDLVLLDEPETHLDPKGLGLLQGLIAEWKARGTAIICATHAADRFRGLGDLEIHLQGGRPDPSRGAS